MIDVILKAPTSSHKWLGAKDGEAVMQFLSEWQKSCLKTLSQSGEHGEVLRAQGKLEVLNRILGLKDEIRHYQDNLRAGKVQNVTAASARSGLIRK